MVFISYRSVFQLCGFVSELAGYHTCPEHAAAGIDEIISFVVPIPRELIQHIQSYSAILYELECMGIGNDIKIIIDEIRSNIVSTLEEISIEIIKFAAHEILSLLEYQDLGDLVECHLGDVTYLIDFIFRTIESFGISEFAITFEDDCKYIILKTSNFM